MELIGRFWRAPFQRQTLYVLKKMKHDEQTPEKKIKVGLTYHPYIYGHDARHLFHIRA